MCPRVALGLAFFLCLVPPSEVKAAAERRHPLGADGAQRSAQVASASAKTVAETEKLVSALRRAQVSGMETVLGLGVVKQSWGNSLDFAPGFRSFSHVSLVYYTPEWIAPSARPNRKVPYYIVIDLLNTSRVKLADLRPKYGQWRGIPPNPEGNPFRVVFSGDHSARLLEDGESLVAYLSGPATNPRSYVTELQIQREPLLGK